MTEDNDRHQKKFNNDNDNDNDTGFSFRVNSSRVPLDQDNQITSLVSTDDSWVTLYENVLSSQESNALLHELHENLPWNVETDQFGPQTRPTCYFANPDCTFSYVGLTLDPPAASSNDNNNNDNNDNNWHPTVLKLKDCVTLAVADQLLPPSTTTTTNDSPPPESSPLTACLVNLYPEEAATGKGGGGQGFIPWHYDEIRAHGKDKIVASLSLGGPRRFQLRTRGALNNNSKETPRMVADLWLPSGSILLMKGEVQENYEHCLPLETKEGGSKEQEEEEAEESAITINPLRISLTFRSIVPGYEKNNHSIPAMDDPCCTDLNE
ncbi:MAG: hypothetical protein SGBAC_006111 [Bacillariaceae sp.]